MLLRQHNVLQRHALLLKAVLSPLDDNDRDRLEVSECLCKAPCAGQALSELYACAFYCRAVMCPSPPSASAIT